LNDPIQCTLSSAIVLYLHNVHQKRVQQCACVVKVCEHHIHLCMNWASKYAAMDAGRLKSGSCKLKKCLFKLFISNHAFAIASVRPSKTCKALITSLTMCSIFSHCCQNPSSQIVALIACKGVRLVTILPIKQCAHVLIPPWINDHLLQSIFDFMHASNHEEVACKPCL
jgi:hypothetical protein